MTRNSANTPEPDETDETSETSEVDNEDDTQGTQRPAASSGDETLYALEPYGRASGEPRSEPPHDPHSEPRTDWYTRQYTGPLDTYDTYESPLYTSGSDIGYATGYTSRFDEVSTGAWQHDEQNEQPEHTAAPDAVQPGVQWIAPQGSQGPQAFPQYFNGIYRGHSGDLGPLPSALLSSLTAPTHSPTYTSAPPVPHQPAVKAPPPPPPAPLAPEATPCDDLPDLFAYTNEHSAYTTLTADPLPSLDGVADAVRDGVRDGWGEQQTQVLPQAQPSVVPSQPPATAVPDAVRRLWQWSARGRAVQRNHQHQQQHAPQDHAQPRYRVAQQHSRHQSQPEGRVAVASMPRGTSSGAHSTPYGTSGVHDIHSEQQTLYESRGTVAQARYASWQTVPPGGAGALWQQIEARREQQMAMLVDISRPTLTAAEPPNIASLVHYTRDARSGGYGLTLRLQPGLPPHTLALLWPMRHEIYLSDRLFPPMALAHLESRLQQPAHLRESSTRVSASGADIFASSAPGMLNTHNNMAVQGGDWEYYLNELPTLRFVVSVLWTLWYAFDELSAIANNVALDDLRTGQVARSPIWSPNQPFSVAFYPVRTTKKRDWATQQKDWDATHARYYSALWQTTGRLLTNHEQLRAQTAEYFNLPVEEIPAIGPALREMVSECVPPTLMRRYPDPRERAVAAWEHYVSYIAQRSIVPQALVRSRLELRRDDTERRIQTPFDLLGMTNELLDAPFGASELDSWRADAARLFGAHPEHTALWLAEPSAWMPGVPRRANVSNQRAN